MGVSLRVLSLDWLGVGSCRGFGGRERLCGYHCGYFMASGKTRGFSFRIQVANMTSTSVGVLQFGWGNDTRIDFLHMTGLTIRKEHSKHPILRLRQQPRQSSLSQYFSTRALQAKSPDHLVSHPSFSSKLRYLHWVALPRSNLSVQGFCCAIGSLYNP